MMDREALARRALTESLRTRQRAGVAFGAPICPFDTAEQLGIEVRFVDIPSLEGMYLAGPQPHILLPSDRPPGRQRFGCAHELGHHLFGHGTRPDAIGIGWPSGTTRDPEEYLADCFGGFLMMPKAAVVRGFSSRGWSIAACTPDQAFTVSGWLGVSYEGFITHAHRSLRLMSSPHATLLRKSAPSEIRKSILGAPCPSDLLIADAYWTDRAVDVQIGDHVLVPEDTLAEGNLLEWVGEIPDGKVFRAVRPGCGRLSRPVASWSCFVRVQRHGYGGRAIFRHLPDPDHVA